MIVSPSRVPAFRSARLLAQAKVNLALRVLAREESGYHQLETIFQRLTLGDTVTLKVTDGERSLDVSGADTGPVERNLAWRAAVAYAERTGWPRGWRIELAKLVPPGGGLGGGSADAGAVLRMLNRLNPSPLDASSLLEIACSLGADVPFLSADFPLALAWGRGERMLALDPLPARPVGLWLYPFGVSTAEAFGWLAEDRSRGAGAQTEFAHVWTPESLGDWHSVANIAWNDLEAPVLARHPELAAGLAVLSGGSTPVLARMTGTGSTLFSLPLGDVAGWEPAAVLAGGTGPEALRLVKTATAVRVEEVELIE